MTYQSILFVEVNIACCTKVAVFACVNTRISIVEKISHVFTR